jgi:uncharacterized membrane protein
MKVFAFNAKGSKVIIHVRAMEIYVAIVEVLRKKKSMMKLSFLPKLVEKLILVPIISFLKFSSPIMNLMPYMSKLVVLTP